MTITQKKELELIFDIGWTRIWLRFLEEGYKTWITSSKPFVNIFIVTCKVGFLFRKITIYRTSKTKNLWLKTDTYFHQNQPIVRKHRIRFITDWPGFPTSGMYSFATIWHKTVIFRVKRGVCLESVSMKKWYWAVTE